TVITERGYRTLANRDRDELAALGIKVASHDSFRWLGRVHHGSHDALVSHETFRQVQHVLGGKPRVRLPKSRHAFMGLLTCARCGCQMTAETKKSGRYTYYHCTGYRGRCGNTYIREEELAVRLADVVERIQIPTELAERLSDSLRDSHMAME